MSNRKRPSAGFIERTTVTSGEGVTITPPKMAGPTRKFFVGSDHEPTEEEALEMGRALYDQITQQRARDARATGD